jgi:hypothetical protein
MSRPQIVWFLMWRAWWHFACWLTFKLVDMGFPAWFVNGAGPFLGTGYAFRACRRMGWHPFSGEGKRE